MENVFHFNENENNFESFAQANSFQFWYATDLMNFLGYEHFNKFKDAINKAIGVCTSLMIPIEDNFVLIERTIDNKKQKDYKLSRFACYLVTMNGDVKKPNVAKAQAYFITLAESFRQYIQETGNIERFLTREELSKHEKSLSGTAKEAGVIDYALFQNAGYRGMYNMNLKDLKIKKMIDVRDSLLDYMGGEELAANLFRITQTEAKIRNENIKGQKNLETAHFQVGRKIRQTMQEISSIKPEDLPIEEHIKEVKKGIKKTHNEMKKIKPPDEK